MLPNGFAPLCNAMRRLIPISSFLLTLIGSVAAVADFPAVDEPGFVDTCRDMYMARDNGQEWPMHPAGTAHHCTLRIDGSDPAAMAADDYRWALRKSLTFACKGRREVMFDLLRRLSDCAGEERTLSVVPQQQELGACQITIVETDETFIAAKPLINDLIEWRDNMPWYESVLVDLFAPDEFPLIVDGLIACGHGR